MIKFNLIFIHVFLFIHFLLIQHQKRFNQCFNVPINCEFPFISFSCTQISFIILRYKGNVCQTNTNHYESHTIPNDIKDGHENRRNQQVYTASPVKIIDKDNDSEMYEISPYATFSVTGGRTVSQGHSKTPTRGAHTPSALDYTMQFKTFGHPEGELDLNATAYPILPSGGFGHVKGKSSWHKQRYYNTDGKLN